MPRIILGFLAGSGLALCGCVMQAVVQNPMADPYILGVSAGATLGATGSLFLGLGVISGFWAFVGAGGACFLVLALSSADGKTTSVKLILSGMIVNALLTAFSNFIIAVSRRFGRYDVHQVLDNGLPDPRRMEKHRPYHTDCAGGSSLFPDAGADAGRP